MATTNTYPAAAHHHKEAAGLDNLPAAAGDPAAAVRDIHPAEADNRPVPAGDTGREGELHSQADHRIALKHVNKP
jgi:hypothetical protein